MGALGSGVPFWEQVDKTDACWVWTGAMSDSGYGTAYDPRTQKVSGAHRYAYELTVGPIPEGLDLDHLCRNRACVNPAHLEPVSRRENLLRAPATLAAQNAAKTHCVNGHEFSAENTYITPKGKRHCRPCGRERSRAQAHRRKAA